jgi:hypothetical protein
MGDVTYHKLKITATDPSQAIYLADEDGLNLVQKEIGVMDTSLLPGKYMAFFGLGAQGHRIDLTADLEITQAALQS